MDKEEDEIMDAKRMASRIHTTSIKVTSGTPRKLVNSVARGEGFKAWHELIKFYDPRTISDKLAEYSKITHPAKRAKDH